MLATGLKFCGDRTILRFIFYIVYFSFGTFLSGKISVTRRLCGCVLWLKAVEATANQMLPLLASD